MFSVDRGQQHDEKNGTIIYSLLPLNDDKRLNIVPTKSSVWKRGNDNTFSLMGTLWAGGGGTREQESLSP